MRRRAGFLSAMASNLTFQSRNVLSKKLMVKKEVRGTKRGTMRDKKREDEGRMMMKKAAGQD